jgi:hypothetical protein
VAARFLGTLLTTLPLWRWLDPLPVLDEREREDRKKTSRRTRMRSAFSR